MSRTQTFFWMWIQNNYRRCRVRARYIVARIVQPLSCPKLRDPAPNFWFWSRPSDCDACYRRGVTVSRASAPNDLTLCEAATVARPTGGPGTPSRPGSPLCPAAPCRQSVTYVIQIHTIRRSHKEQDITCS